MELYFFLRLYFFLSLFFTTYAMDPVPLEKKDKSSRRLTLSINAVPHPQSFSKKNRLGRANSTRSLSLSSSSNQPQQTEKIKTTTSEPLNIGKPYSNNSLSTELQTLIRKNECSKIVQFLTNNDPNYPYFPGKNTLLHKCVLEHNSTIAGILVRDFRMYSLVENESERTAYEHLIGNDILIHDQLYTLLCDRSRIDLIVDAFIMAVDKLTQNPYDNKFLDTMVIFLHKKLPAKIFPEYATIPFIVTMLKHRLPSKNLIMNILYDNPGHDTLHTKIQHAIYLHDAEFLSKNNPNALHGPEQFSLLHMLVEKHDEPKIMLFLINPYITVLTKNKEGLRPSKYIKNTIYRNLFTEFLLRETLDNIVHAMIVTDKNIVQKKYSSDTLSQKITNLLARIPSHILPSYVTISFISTMIRAQLRYNRETLLNTYLRYKKNHNYQDDEGNTLLHQAVYLRDKHMVESLIRNAHVTCLKKNKDNLLAQGLLYSLDQQEIRALLFMRDSLERWALEPAELILMTNPSLTIDTLTIDIDFIQQAIKDIKHEAQQVKEKQMVTNGIDEDGQLPIIAADLPNYATDAFLFELIKNCLLARKLKKQKLVAK